MPEWEQATGGGGSQLAFKRPADAALKGKLAKGIDLKRRGGSVLLPPSMHKSGKRYRPTAALWPLYGPQEAADRSDYEEFYCGGPEDMPGWLIEAATKPARTSGSHTAGKPVDLRGGWSTFEEAVLMIQPTALCDGAEIDLDGYCEWLKVGMSIHHQAAASDCLDEGLELWDKWAERLRHYDRVSFPTNGIPSTVAAPMRPRVRGF